MVTMRIDETWHRLKEWTYGQAASERLAAQILYASDFKDVDPSHPLGGRDGGKDAICTKDGNKWVMAVYFPRGQMSFKDITTKFNDDLKGAKKNNAFGIAFVTNQELTNGERDTLEKLGQKLIPKISVSLFHIEIISTRLDTPPMAGVRYQYLGIPIVQAASNSYDKKLFGDFVAALPSGCTALDLLNKVNFGTSFSSTDIDHLTEINQCWHDATHEFVDSELNDQLKKFLAALDKFLREISQSANVGHREDKLTIGIADWENEQEKFALAEKLSDLASDVYKEQQSLIRIGLRKIS